MDFLNLANLSSQGTAGYGSIASSAIGHVLAQEIYSYVLVWSPSVKLRICPERNAGNRRAVEDGRTENCVIPEVSTFESISCYASTSSSLRRFRGAFGFLMVT